VVQKVEGRRRQLADRLTSMRRSSTRSLWLALALFTVMSGPSCKGPNEPAPLRVAEPDPVPSQVATGNLDVLPTSEREQAIELVRTFLSERYPSPDWTFSAHWGQRIQKWVVVALRPPAEGRTQSGLQFFYVDLVTGSVEMDNIM
jgi:hypothetical protein